jgi:hypothetical protein
VDLGRQQGAPARIAVARLLYEDDAGAKVEHRREFDGAIGKGEELDIELFRHLAQKVIDAYGAAVRQRKGKVGREDGTRRRPGANAPHHAMAVRNHRVRRFHGHHRGRR